MKGFKRCHNGHFFKEDLDSCPYCPKSGDAGATQISGLSDKTQISGMNTQHMSNDPGKTQLFGAGNPSQSTQVFGAGKGEGNKGRDLNRTFIQGMESEGEDGNANTEKPRATRMITGWVISYTLDSMGLDFRIYEGNNTIGRDPENTITISKDPAISGRHVTILYRKGSFYIKDEMTANGTYLNGEEMEIGKPYDLKDGDDIRLGNTTTFKFKSAI